MKATYLHTMGNIYYNEKTFEYRGKEYTVEYSSGYTTFSKKPAYIQHKEAQAKIDSLLDNPINNEIEPSEWDKIEKEVWEMLGW